MSSGKTLDSFFKIRNILIVFSSVEPAFKKEENMFLDFDIDLSN